MKIFILSALFLLGTLSASAQEYRPLAPIPQLAPTNSASTTSSFFLQNLVPLLISIAGGLAVIRIVIGGVQYMTTDAWNGKSEAKGTIQQALLGLLLAMGSYTILYTLNPELLNIRIAPQAQNVGGDPFDTDSTNQTGKNAEELGCNNCIEIPRDEMSVSLSACDQATCYIQNRVLINLERLKDTKNEDNRIVNWQVTRAFPRSESSFSCFKPNIQGNTKAGFCVELALPNPTNQNVKAFLEKLSGIELGLFRNYVVPTETRRTAIRNIPGLSNSIKDKVIVVAGSTEHVRFGEF